LNNRFFRLDLPPFVDTEGNFIYDIPDNPGRGAGEFIWPTTVQVYRFVASATPQTGDVDNVALYEDPTGRWDSFGGLTDDPNFDWVTDHAVTGQRWRPVDFDPLLDQGGNTIAIDLRRSMDNNDIIGVLYTVVGDLADPTNTVLYQVGDRPGQDEDNRVDIDGTGVLHLRMKLLKPQNPEAYTFQYVLRNIYSLGGSNIDPESFDLRIEVNEQADNFPNIDENSGLDWFRIFGLDQQDPQGNPGPDNQIDKNNTFLFDLQRGLLKFPLEMAKPFNADPALYTRFAASDTFDFDASKLKTQRIPEIYDPDVLPHNYNEFNRWYIVATY
jgi:hypothetical protein